MFTTLDKAVRWAQGNSIYPMSFGLACCAIEWMGHVASRVDIARFGFEAARASPRQADTIFISGRVSIKMAPIIRRLYDQMLEPKFAIAMGACSSSMGVFNNYAIVPADKFMPIDVHVPGCPPRPEALVHGILKLRDMVQADPKLGWRERYGAVGTEEIVPAEGQQTARQRLRRSGRHACLTRPVSSSSRRSCVTRMQSRSSTPCTSAARARSSSSPESIRAVLGRLREQGLHLPRQRARRRLLPRGAAARRALRAAGHGRASTA